MLDTILTIPFVIFDFFAYKILDTWIKDVFLLRISF